MAKSTSIGKVCNACNELFASNTLFKKHRWEKHTKHSEPIIESEWEVKNIKGHVSTEDIRAFVEKEHYSKGASCTSVYTHGLYQVGSDVLRGVALWMPPTRNACESVNKKRWRRVLALSRLAIEPSVPKNGASFFLVRSIELIRAAGDYVSLVTYADESQSHTGLIYKKSGWQQATGEPTKTYRWLDKNGKQVSVLSTVSRTTKQMEELGYTKSSQAFKKLKFEIHFPVSTKEGATYYNGGDRVEFVVFEKASKVEICRKLLRDLLGVSRLSPKYDVQYSESSRVQVHIDSCDETVFVLFDACEEVFTAVGWITGAQAEKKIAAKIKAGKHITEIQGFELNTMKSIKKTL